MVGRLPLSIQILILGLAFCSQTLMIRSGIAATLLPENVELRSNADRQPMLLEATDATGFIGPVTGEITWSSSDESVARVKDGVVTPVGNGEATIRATGMQGDREVASTSKVKVVELEKRPWDFGRHVLPVLSKAGCNSGACHGALAGKGGFKLSLNGYNPAGDFTSITRHAKGRRVELADPGRSLLLAKPSMDAATQRRLKVGQGFR